MIFVTEKEERRVDLHTHTTASDGTLTPRELVKLAGELGLAAVAITDHDTVAGLREGLAAGEELGVRVIPGVEISTDEEGCEVHIVGLFIRPDCPELLEFLEGRKQERIRRNGRLLERLREIGMPLSPEEVEPGAGGLLTRTHVAEAMARKGWAATPVEALERYLIPGKPGWVEKNSPRPRECAAIIHKAGGLAFLAHLDRIDKGNREHSLAIARRVLVTAELDGLEARYATYTPEWEAEADRLAEELGLLRSGGSDFHGARKANRLGSGLGGLFVPESWLAVIEKSRPGLQAGARKSRG